jgi:hypothetical protein
MRKLGVAGTAASMRGAEQETADCSNLKIGQKTTLWWFESRIVNLGLWVLLD